ncbi:MAG: class I SAM-dependent methyltransferase [Chloroflexota bacterium]
MTGDVGRRVRAAYDDLVSVYAESNHGAMPDELTSLARSIVVHAGIGSRIIDVGCGIGRDMAWFEQRGLAVTGVDLSEGMLGFARGMVQGSLAAMDMQQLGLASDVFDGAWCCASLLHLPKDSAPLALGEIRRVLKRGAMLVLSVQEGAGESWEASYGTNSERYFARYQAGEVVDMLIRTGFCVKETGRSVLPLRTWLTFVCYAESPDPED